jgi:GNAT superfamily N-acetyltransferase
VSDVLPGPDTAVEEVAAADVLLLRSVVLRPGLPLEASQYAQDDDPDAHHLAVRLGDGRIVGCATYFPDPWPGDELSLAGPTWRLRGMATAPEVRGTGTGGVLLAAGIDLVRRVGAVLLWCNARTTAIGFYERYAFRIEPEEFYEGPLQIPHHRAWRPVHDGDGAVTARP